MFSEFYIGETLVGAIARSGFETYTLELPPGCAQYHRLNGQVGTLSDLLRVIRFLVPIECREFIKEVPKRRATKFILKVWEPPERCDETSNCQNAISEY